MKRITIIALIFVAFSVSAVYGQKAAGNKAGLEKTVNGFFELVKASNADKIKTYYTDDYTFTGPDGKIVNAETRIKMMKDGTGPVVLAYSDITVRTYGNSGLATGVVATRNSSGATQQSRFLQVWVWKGGRWWLAASQVTPVI